MPSLMSKPTFVEYWSNYISITHFSYILYSFRINTKLRKLRNSAFFQLVSLSNMKYSIIVLNNYFSSSRKRLKVSLLMGQIFLTSKKSYNKISFLFICMLIYLKGSRACFLVFERIYDDDNINSLMMSILAIVHC